MSNFFQERKMNKGNLLISVLTTWAGFLTIIFSLQAIGAEGVRPEVIGVFGLIGLVFFVAGAVAIARTIDE
jgi:hypothetical protein